MTNKNIIALLLVSFSTAEHVIAPYISCLQYLKRIKCRVLFENYDCEPYFTIAQTDNYFRSHFLPICMLNNDNWELCYHTWTLGSTCYLDILLCCEVLSLTSTLSFKILC